MNEVIPLNHSSIVEKTNPENELRYFVFQGTDGKPFFVTHSKLLEVFGGFPVHTHEISDINSLQDELNSKANTSHTHAIGDINGLQNDLDSKASINHTHNMLPISIELLLNINSNPVIAGPAVSAGQMWETTIKMHIDQNNHYFDSRQHVILSSNGSNAYRYNHIELGTIGTGSVGPVNGVLQAGFSPDASVISTPKSIGFTYRRLC